MKNSLDHQNLATAYLKHYRSGSEEDFWAFESVIEACNDLDFGLKLTLSLIAQCENEMELSYVAAGPLEDILKWHGNSAIPEIEKASEYSEKVRKALSGVWINDKCEAYKEWKRLMNKFGFQNMNKPRRQTKMKSRSKIKRKF